MQFNFIKRLIRSIPGEETFGNYRILPLFFIAGAALEFVMIKWNVGEVNFYHTFKKRRAKEIITDVSLGID